MCPKMDALWAAGWILFLISAAALPEIPSKGKQTKVLDSQSSSSEDTSMPRFAEPIPNVTVSIGKDALLACVVENLKGYKVAWVRVDTQTILSIHHNVITQNNRISLTYNDHRSWYLHIKEVEENDRGWYMCQVNTDPMRSRKGYLQVVVPPLIIEGMTSNDMVVREGTNVTLMCKARGYPEPYVMWRREDGEEMSIGGETVNVVDGEILHITKVSRLHMAAYLCVASNGVPPSISKRVHLRVQFPPMLSIPNQLEGAYVGQEVTLECHTEAYPASINYWTTERGDMIISDTSRAGDKYETTSSILGYSKYMKLKIRNVSTNDFGSYRCVAKNSLGETDGVIKLDEILAPTTAVMSEITMYNRTLDGKRPNRNKFETNALPDYGVEEWKGTGVGGIDASGSGDNGQASPRNPAGAFHNSAVSIGGGRGRLSHFIRRLIHWIESKSLFFHSSDTRRRIFPEYTMKKQSTIAKSRYRQSENQQHRELQRQRHRHRHHRRRERDWEHEHAIEHEHERESEPQRTRDKVMTDISESPICLQIFIIFNLISIELWRRICLMPAVNIGTTVAPTTGLPKTIETTTTTAVGMGMGMVAVTRTRTRTIISPSVSRIKR